MKKIWIAGAQIVGVCVAATNSEHRNTCGELVIISDIG